MVLTEAKLHAMVKSDQEFAGLVKIHGLPVAVADCREGGHDGEICMAGRCVSRKMLVIRCDHFNGCTKYETINC